MEKKIVLEGKDISVSFLKEKQEKLLGKERQQVLKKVSFFLREGECLGLLGESGSGKSTLGRVLSGLLKQDSGTLEREGRISIVFQDYTSSVNPSFQVFQIIGESLDVLSKQGGKHFSKGEKKEKILELLQLVGLREEHYNRFPHELSGGQRQRVWIALALAQQTDILFLDEPTTFLDIAYQVEILDLLGELNRTKKTTIIMVLHDINLSVRYADYIFALKSGNLYAEGQPEEVISEKLIKDVYGLDSKVITDPTSAAPMVIPIGKYNKELEACL